MKRQTLSPPYVTLPEKMRKMATSTSWVPWVMSLTERAILSKGGKCSKTDDDVSSIGSDNSHATFTTMTTDLTTASAVRRKVAKRRMRERTMKAAELRAREKRLGPLSLVSLFAPHVAKQVQRDGGDVGKKKKCRVFFC